MTSTAFWTAVLSNIVLRPLTLIIKWCEYRHTDQLKVFLIRSHNQQMAQLPSQTSKPQDSTGGKQGLALCGQPYHTSILFCKGFTIKTGERNSSHDVMANCPASYWDQRRPPEESSEESQHKDDIKPQRSHRQNQTYFGQIIVNLSLHPCSTPLSYKGALSVWFNVPISPVTCTRVYFKF